MDSNCIFCKIVAGEAPASVIYQDDQVMAFMTLHPTRPGEFLIIPKRHIDEFCDVPDDLACHIIKLAQRFSKSLRKHFGPKRVGLIVHGFGVPHAHLIVLPQHEESDIVSGRHVIVDGGKVRFGDSHLPTPERAELDRQASLIAGKNDNGRR
jgi:histidine triad (HIT) family protein